MIIDFHTHAFPDKIAYKTIDTLARKANIPKFRDGAVSDLRESSRDAGIDKSVVLPIATKSGQETTINKFAAEINGTERIISFGSIHPKTENYKEVLDTVKAYGLPGIKLHPDYQGFFVDDESTYPMLEYAARLGLVIVYHAGSDYGFRGEIKNTPVRARKMLHAIGYDKFVMAHMGANALYGDVLEVLCGENVYFDTSFALGRCDDSMVKAIISAHGDGKLLFGTDSPWDSQTADVRYLKNMDLPEGTKEKIFYKNAARLLGLEE